MSDFNAKYRPQTISELDLLSIREELERVLKSEEIPHSFLLTGPKGIGKTSSARIIAKAVNCLNKQGFEPCNKCEQCLSITNGSNLDVLEIDAASNRGIDDIRELRERVKLVPTKAKYKVYIIDEVHMLTNEAFNALLKTLEEPPVHVIFILCTTAAEKLPDTIISRCLRINFKRAGREELIEKLKRIAKKENIEVGEEALAEIAKAGGGSFRDATKILQQASFRKQVISGNEVKEILGQGIGVDPKKLLELLSGNKIKEALEEINYVVETGENLRGYSERIMEILRSLLLTRYGLSNEGVDTSNLNFNDSEVKKLIEDFSKAALELKEAVIPQLPFEIVVAGWGIRNDGQGTGNKEQKTNKDEQEKVGEAEKKIEKKQEPEKAEQVTEIETLRPEIKRESGVTITIEDVKGRWADFLLAVKPKNHSIEAFLKATRPIEVKNNFLVLEVFYQFHKEQLENAKCRRIMETALEQLFETPITIKCILGEKAGRKLEVKSENEDEELVKTAEEIFK